MDISDETKPAEIREDMNQNLLMCQSVIVPYENTPLPKVRQYLMNCQRMQSRRKKEGEPPLKMIAVCDVPVPKKPALKMKLPAMKIFNCQEDNVLEMIRSLRA